MTPRIVAKLLDDWRVALGARALLCLPFWLSALVRLFDFGGGSSEMAGLGLSPGGFFNSVAIILQLAGAGLVIFFPPLAWLGAAVLAVYTLVMLPLAHVVSTLAGTGTSSLLLAAGDRLAIVGGLIVAAILARRPPRSY